LTERDVGNISALRKERLTGDEIALRLGFVAAAYFAPCAVSAAPGFHHQNGVERVGIRANVCPLMEKDGVLAGPDASLQFSASSSK
jgi:hypothetical protein